MNESRSLAASASRETGSSGYTGSNPNGSNDYNDWDGSFAQPPPPGWDNHNPNIGSGGGHYPAKLPHPEPMMIEPGGHHSLPDSEELRADQAPQSSSGFGRKCKVFCVAVLVALTVVAVSVGLAVGLQNKRQRQRDSSRTSNNNLSQHNQDGGRDPAQDVNLGTKSPVNGNTNNIQEVIASTSAPTPQVTVPPGTDVSQRGRAIQMFLVNAGISNLKMSQPGSPQKEALDFLVQGDPLFLSVPSSTDSAQGKAFLTRYLMVLLYYSTNGPHWQLRMHFLSGVDTCKWYTVVILQDGSEYPLGVGCNPDTKEVETLIFCKWEEKEGRSIQKYLLCTVYTLFLPLFASFLTK